MNRMIAEKLVEELLSCTKSLDKIEKMAREIDDEKLQMKFRRAVAGASHDLYADVMGIVIVKFPELDPYPVEARKPKNK